MNDFKISDAKMSVKILATAVLMGTAITYLILVLHIFIDTEFKVSLIKEAYGGMEWIELTSHTHKYFPYYGIYIFAFIIFLFVLGTSYSERLKIVCVIVPSVLIVLDIGSMWAIPYIHAGIFSWGLMIAGNLLAMSFGCIFALTFCDIWLKQTKIGALVQKICSKI